MQALNDAGIVQGGPSTKDQCSDFVPVLVLDPSDMTCINSILHFGATERNQQGTVPVVFCISFNQSLVPILVVLGSINHIMEVLGLKEIMELVYTGNAVE